MKRASYREAIEWIARNDSAADDGADDPTTVGELVSSLLVADIFDVERGALPRKAGRRTVVTNWGQWPHHRVIAVRRLPREGQKK